MGVPASLVSQEPVPPGRDVAVLRADVSTVPALPLANDEPYAAAATNVIGYPGDRYLSEPPPSDATVKASLATAAPAAGEVPTLRPSAEPALAEVALIGASAPRSSGWEPDGEVSALD